MVYRRLPLCSQRALFKDVVGYSKHGIHWSLRRLQGQKVVLLKSLFSTSFLFIPVITVHQPNVINFGKRTRTCKRGKPD